MDSKRLAASLCRIEIACDSATFAELGTTILALGKSLRFRARGYSMHPLVRDGDLLTIEPVDVRSLQRGDLVFFRNPQGEVVVHRMVRRTGQGDSLSFEVKGDGLPAPDGLVPGKEIFGRVTSIERDGVRMDLRQPGMRLLGLGVALLDPVRVRSIPWLKPLILRAPLLSKYLV